MATCKQRVAAPVLFDRAAFSGGRGTAARQLLTAVGRPRVRHTRLGAARARERARRVACVAEGPLRAVRLECWWSPAYEERNQRALLVRLAGRAVNHDEKRGRRFSVRLCRFTFSNARKEMSVLPLPFCPCQSGQRWPPKLRRGPECVRPCGAPFAATNNSVGGRDLQAA